MRNFISIGEKVVLVSFFRNKFYNAVFIFHFFMNLQRQNQRYSNTYYKLLCRKFEISHSNHWTFWIILQNCIIFSKLTVKHSLENNSKHHSVFVEGMYFCLFFYWYMMKFRLHTLEKMGLFVSVTLFILNFPNLLNWYDFLRGMKTLS